MRELKFRVWSEEDKEYRTDCDVFRLLHGKTGCPATIYNDEGDKFIIEQYTGLKDKNGKEIYEGDIIQEEIDFNSKMIDGVFTYAVEWDMDTLCYSLRGSSNSIHDELWEVNASVEIIGNIHENPELLKEAK